MKAVASLRRNSQLVAEAGFHLEMSALNSLQPENRPLAAPTLLTSHWDRSRLKTEQPPSMLFMSVTCETSHREISWLKSDGNPRPMLQRSMWPMSVILLISQVFITHSSPSQPLFWQSLTALITSFLWLKPVRVGTVAAGMVGEGVAMGSGQVQHSLKVRSCGFAST